jgi:hypothetical protein
MLNFFRVGVFDSIGEQFIRIRLTRHARLPAADTEIMRE